MQVFKYAHTGARIGWDVDNTYLLTSCDAASVFVHTHGGAWVFGGGDSALREAVWVASGLGVKVVSVDYRRPPLHPFPAAVDDAVAVWLAVGHFVRAKRCPTLPQKTVMSRLLLISAPDGLTVLLTTALASDMAFCLAIVILPQGRN